MSELEHYRGGPSHSRMARRTSRDLAWIDGRTDVQLARVHSVTDIQVATVDAVTEVGQRAQQGVAFLSQVEQQLSQAVPLAAPRLQGIGDLAALLMGQVVTDTVMKLRRL